MQSTSQPSSSEQLLGAYIPEHYHYQMLLDEARMSTFQEAIALAVPEGGRVLELGTGTGVLASFAAQRAKCVWAVERQPTLADRARTLIARNGLTERVEVITADARSFVPSEPVDAVICEMLHSALLREHQVEVIAAFQSAYLAQYERLPVMIPTATLLGIEPVMVDFSFFGYDAPLPIFEDPNHPLQRIRSAGVVVPYAIADYQSALPTRFRADLVLEASEEWNALRFVTSNVLAIRPDDHSTVSWLNQNLILPMQSTQAVAPTAVQFDYRPGEEIADLARSVRVGT